MVGCENHIQEGCNLICGDSSVCKYRDDKVYNEWANLFQAPVEESPKKKTKRGKTNCRKARKRLKLQGKEYQSAKGKTVPARKAMQWEDCKCKNKCVTNLVEEDRKTLYEMYWSLASDNERRQYIMSMTSSKEPAQRTTKKKENSRRKQTVLYFLTTSDDVKLEVCPKVFFATLQVTRKFVRYTRQNGIHGFSKPDSRGQSEPKNKLVGERLESVLRHMNSFPRVEGHYVRKSSKMNYIEDTTNFSKLTKASMHQLYLVECRKEGVDNPVGLTKYKEVLESQNIKIHQPKKDQCKICTKYNRSNEEERKELEASQQTHITNKNKVMELKEAYKTRAKEDTKLMAFNFDLEAVLYTPCDKVSTIFYKRKLCTYNATTFNLVTRTGHCYMWNESEGKRGSNEIGTSIHKYLEKFKGREVVMFSDTCGGQNRNQFTFAYCTKPQHH